MLKATLLICAVARLSISHAFVLSNVPSLESAQVQSVSRPVSLRPASAVPFACSQVTMVAKNAQGSDLHDPATRVTRYGDNMAQYLLDLHESRAVFDFCGGMMFQLVLTDKLRKHLQTVAGSGESQPVVFDADTLRMSNMGGYEKSAFADNRRLFHGREVRQVPQAEGGMGFVLQLSFAGPDEDKDAEGWTGTYDDVSISHLHAHTRTNRQFVMLTSHHVRHRLCTPSDGMPAQEIAGYDGWAHDTGRVWRDGQRLENEGCAGFRGKFGAKAFTLNHRFYLHLDEKDRLWLAAEDGCEGTPAAP